MINKSATRYSPLHFIAICVWMLLHFSVSAQVDTAKTGLSLDLGWTRNKNINLWPVYVHKVTKEEKDFQLIFPIYRHYRNYREGDNRSHFLPFYCKDSSAKGHDFRLLSLFYPSLLRISDNNLFGTHTFKILEIVPHVSLFELTRSADRKVLQYNFLFFLLHGNNMYRQRSYFVAFPLYWSFKNPRESSTTFFPLFSRTISDSGKNKLTVITPLFWHYKKGEKKGNIIFPVFWSFKQKDHYRQVIFPLWWSRYDVFHFQGSVQSLYDTNIYKSFFPLYWHHNEVRNTGGKRLEVNNTTIIPFFWEKDDSAFHSLTVLPFFSVGHSKDGVRKYLVVTPLFWHIKNKTTNKNFLFPVWWNSLRVDAPGSDTALGYDTTRASIVFPFYWHFTHIINGYHDRQAEDRVVFFPVIWKNNTDRYKRFTAFPLFSIGHDKDSSRSYVAVTPLFWHVKTKTGHKNVIFPLWWNSYNVIHHSDSLHSFDDTSRANVIFPFYWRYSDIDIYNGKRSNVNHTILFPLYWKLQSPLYQSLTVMPFFSVGHSPDGVTGHLAITPLFWHFKRKNGYKNVFFPLWWNAVKFRGKDTSRTNVIFPILWTHSYQDKKRIVMFPVFWSFRSQERKAFTFFPFFSLGINTALHREYAFITPLFWHFKTPFGHRNIIFPLWWNAKRYNDGDTSHSTTFFPVYWSFKNKQVQYHILFPFVWHFKSFNNKSFTIIPFFSFGSDTVLHRKYLVVTPLFWHFKSKDRAENVLFPIWWSGTKTSVSDTMHYNILFPFYWSKHSKNESYKAIFPFIWEFSSLKYSSFTFVPFFSFGHSPDYKCSHLVITPLFWSIHKPGIKEASFCPFVNYYNDSLGVTKLNILYVLFRYRNGPAYKRFSFVWPLVEYAQEADYKYFRFAPLVWYKKTRHTKFFTIQPFYTFHKDTNKECYRILEELVTYKRYFHKKKSLAVLWKLLTWDRYDNKDYDFRILYLLYANVHKDGNVEKSIWPFYHIIRKANGDKSFAAAFGFFQSSRRHVEGTKEYYREIKLFWFIRILSNYKALKAKGITRQMLNRPPAN